MEETNVLVTGGCGFLGTAIVSALLSTKRFSITAMDINPPSLGNSAFPTTVRYVRADVLDRSALQKVFAEAKPAIVVHTVGVFPLGAARYSRKGQDAVFKINVEGTKNVLNAAKECGAKGLVYTSSVTVVMDSLTRDFRNVDENWPAGDVDTAYGQSKVRYIQPHPPSTSNFESLLPFLPFNNLHPHPPHLGHSRIPHPLLLHPLIPHLCSPLRPDLRSHRRYRRPNNPRPNRRPHNTFHPRRRHKSARLRLHR
jgi:hypothetical protein